tara:strand:- start:27313 stop:27729 length:417 start_codon:yes stop_codon:yes gene_type:complete
MIEAIDKRLWAWSEYRMGGGMRLGGTGDCVLAAVIAGKGEVIRSSVMEVYIPDEVLDTAQAVDKLPDDLRRVVDVHYLQANLSPDQKAIRCRLSRKTFYRRLDTAHQYVLYLLTPPKRRVQRVTLGRERPQAVRVGQR